MPAVISGLVTAPAMWAGKSILVNQPEGYASLGTITVAESWRLVPLFLCSMIAQANLPIMTQLHSAGNMSSFRKVLGAQFCLNGVIALVGAVAVSIFARPIMAAYGPDFKADSIVLILVIISTVPMQLTTVIGSLNRCIGKIWWNAFLNGSWAVSYVLGTILLVEYKAIGLALSLFIAYSLQFILAILYVYVVIWRSSHLRSCVSCSNKRRTTSWDSYGDSRESDGHGVQ